MKMGTDVEYILGTSEKRGYNKEGTRISGRIKEKGGGASKLALADTGFLSVLLKANHMDFVFKLITIKRGG